VCSIDGWCTQNGSFQPLLHVWGTSATDLWSTGEGILQHWDGVAYRGLSGMPFGALAIGGSGPNDVWFGGFLHWDGVTLAKAANPVPGTVNGMWFAASDDGWAVGPGGSWHWDGATWTAVATGAPFGLVAIDGSSSTDVWAVGGPSLKHWDGVAWSDPVPYPPVAAGNVFADAIKVIAPDDVWVGVWHFSGGAWTASGPSGVRAISGTTPDNVFFVTPAKNYRWDGAVLRDDVLGSNYPCNVCSCMSSFDTPTGVRFIATAVNGTPTSGGDCPLFRRYYNGVQTVERVGNGHADGGYFGRYVAWGNDGTIGGETLLRIGPGTKPPGATTLWGITSSDTVVGVSGFGPDDVWVTGFYQTANMASHWDGAGWTYKALPAKPTSAVGAASPTSAWVITGTSAAYFDGVAWTDKGAVPAKAWKGIWGSGPNDAWLVGNGIAHWDGATWTQVPGTNLGFLEVRGFGANDVVAVYRDGTVWRWNGAVWSPVAGSKRLEPLQPFFVIESSNSIWAVRVSGSAGNGPEPRVLHFDGSCWRTETAGRTVGAGETQGIAVGVNRLWVTRPLETFSRPR
jgi:hypothetical protein